MTIECDIATPVLAGEEGWEPIEAFNEAHSASSFVSGEPDGRRLRVRYFRRCADEALVARIWFGPGAQGPPGHVHGGAVAAALDEAMGFSAWLRDYRVVAARIEVDFRSMVPLESIATIEAQVVRVNGRKVEVEASLRPADGSLAARSSGLFIQLSPEHLEKLGHLAQAARMDPEALA